MSEPQCNTESIIYDSEIIVWNSMVPHVELAFGQTKLSQWQPAETDPMGVVPDVSHGCLLTHYQQLSDFALTSTLLLQSPLELPA